MSLHDINNFAKSIGVSFKNKDLLLEALTHRSYINENRGHTSPHNERLEFLGDAVLELVVTEHLFRNYGEPEGVLTSWRSALVNGDMLSRVAREIGVEEYLLMSRGEAKDTGRARQYLLANSVEAVIGAIYLDSGFGEARKFIMDRIVLLHIDEMFSQKLFLDPKSHFQERAQEETGMTPRYEVISEEGPDHNRTFTVGVFLGDTRIAIGEGNSKQDAQRESARAALSAKGWL